jgi:hypothetical protein
MGGDSTRGHPKKFSTFCHRRLSYRRLFHRRHSRRLLSYMRLSHERLSHERLSHERLSCWNLFFSSLSYRTLGVSTAQVVYYMDAVVAWQTPERVSFSVDDMGLGFITFIQNRGETRLHTSRRQEQISTEKARRKQENTDVNRPCLNPVQHQQQMTVQNDDIIVHQVVSNSKTKGKHSLIPLPIMKACSCPARYSFPRCACCLLFPCPAITSFVCVHGRDY